jgi:hypothetical protein
MPTITVRVSPSGETVIETTGYKGKACQDATRQLEAALGKVEAEHKKPEFFQSAAASAQQQAGQ